MGRPRKYGLDYFPFDVHFFTDTKISRLKAKFGNNGVMVFMILLCKVYEKGFYVDYDDDIILDISFILGVKENFTKQVIRYLLAGSMLDSKLAEERQILTSCPIQRRFQGAKRTPVRVNAAYWLLEKEETASLIELYHHEDNCDKNMSFCNKNPDKYRKNDIKEKRRDKSRGEEREGGKPPDLSPIRNIVDMFNNICVNMPKVKAIGEKRTAKLNALLKLYPIDAIQVGFTEASKSDFLNGRNDRGWTATFDWIIVPDNFRKVIEGNYDNRESKKDDTQRSFELSDIMGMANRFGDI